MSLQLHFAPSSAAMAPHILLEELGVPYERVLVDTDARAHKTPAYLKLNPNGLVPVLVDSAAPGGELVLYESAAICLHLADTHPHAKLMPALGTPERAHAYKWLMWLTNTLQATLIVYFYPHRWVDEGNASGVERLKLHARDRVDGLIDQLEAELARHGGPWLLGAEWSAVDAYAFMLCRWTRNFPRPARALPHINAWQKRVLARPAVQRMFANEGLKEPWF
ncbi:glutathione S-transferase family protein [Caldimonas sp. KR1-144]|uniref:glutathione S-transferase family protein n=1 Tax=Caldimonas sp. KR1-144 TaxID=3400911 RepID=UPI003C11BB92